MTSAFHQRNERIRKAIQRRKKEKGILDDEGDDALPYSSGDISPSDPGDGRIVRKKIADEGEELWYE